MPETPDGEDIVEDEISGVDQDESVTRLVVIDRELMKEELEDDEDGSPKR